STYPLIDAGEAAALVLEHTPVLSVERLALAECAGRALAADLVADAPLPAFPSSAVDGFAVRAADAGRTLRVVGESAAGRPFDGAAVTSAGRQLSQGRRRPPRGRSDPDRRHAAGRGRNRHRGRNRSGPAAGAPQAARGADVDRGRAGGGGEEAGPRADPRLQ